MSEVDHSMNEELLTKDQDQSDRIRPADQRTYEVKVTNKDRTDVDADVQAHRKLDQAT